MHFQSPISIMLDVRVINLLGYIFGQQCIGEINTLKEHKHLNYSV